MLCHEMMLYAIEKPHRFYRVHVEVLYKVCTNA
jgi:hypothetical protein